MKIELQNIIPTPMKGENFSSNSIWGREYYIEKGINYFISSDSGKGKSTILSFLYGLRQDYSGTLLINGINQKEINIDDWSNLRTTKISYLLQDLRLFSHLTVWGNLAIKNDLTKHKTDAEMEEMLIKFGLESKKHQLAGKLSLGQQQRVALIRCFLQPFELLLLDEPFSNIDDKNIAIAIELIESECEKNKGNFILATLGHDYNIENVKTIYL